MRQRQAIPREKKSMAAREIWKEPSASREVGKKRSASAERAQAREETHKTVKSAQNLADHIMIRFARRSLIRRAPSRPRKADLAN